MKKFLVVLIVLLTISAMVFAKARGNIKKTIDVWYGMTGPDGAYINDIMKLLKKLT